MVKDAEANADSDKLEEIEAKNNADLIIHSTESLKEHSSKFQKKTKTRLRSLWRNLSQFLKMKKQRLQFLKKRQMLWFRINEAR